jgi:hypothetical protein
MKPPPRNKAAECHQIAIIVIFLLCDDVDVISENEFILAVECRTHFAVVKLVNA